MPRPDYDLYKDQNPRVEVYGIPSDTKQRPEPRLPVQLPSASRVDLDSIKSIKSAVEAIKKLFSVSTVPIHTLNNSQWELTSDLLVAVEQRGEDDFVACLYDVNVYGYGDTIPESLQDLKEAIVNQYEYLLSESREGTEFDEEVELQFKYLKRNIKKNED